MSEHKKLFKSAGIVSFFTLISRILGFVRDVVIAKMFGTGAAVQAFVVAFRIPNTLRHLVGEGAANAAVIPVLSEYLDKKDNKEFWRVTNLLLSTVVIILAAIALIGTLLAPFIVRIIAFGFVNDPQKLDLTIRLTRIMFSFIFLIGLSAYVMGILNTLKHFAAPAAASCFLNITMIVFGLYLCRYFQEPIIGLSIAVLIGGVLQLIVQIPVLMKNGFRFRFGFDFQHPAIKRIGNLLLPRMLGSSIYQLNVFVDTMFASLGHIVGEGAIAALYYSNRLIQFPTALFGSALATACLPTLSQQSIADDMNSFKKTIDVSLRSLLVLLIPSSIGLLVLSEPIIRLLFERGAFDSLSTQMTSFAMAFYCIGLFAYSGARVMTSCFYALKDTVTPVKITFICLILNVVFNFLLMRVLQVGGLALATSISSIANFFILIFLLRKKIGNLGLISLIVNTLKTFLISLVMGAFCILAYSFSRVTLNNGLSLLISILGGIIVFFLMGWYFKIFPPRFWFRHR